jgi:hypothetical protein
MQVVEHIEAQPNKNIGLISASALLISKSTETIFLDM